MGQPHGDRADVPTPAARRSTALGVALVIAVLAAVNVVDHIVPGSSLWLGPPVACVLLLGARLRGLGRVELGLGAAEARRGVRWGAAIILLVAVVFTVGVLVPLSRSAFLDSRYHESVGRGLLDALVVIPLGTVLLEEIAFRSVLWGVLRVQLAPVWVVTITSVLFGTWHVLPSLHLSSANKGVGAVFAGAGSAGQALSVFGTVCFTAIGGAVFGELRRRTGSVVTSMAAHWATNGLGVLFGLLAWRIDR
jgi:uncharacterized protein